MMSPKVFDSNDRQRFDAVVDEKIQPYLEEADKLLKANEYDKAITNLLEAWKIKSQAAFGASFIFGIFTKQTNEDIKRIEGVANYIFDKIVIASDKLKEPACLEIFCSSVEALSLLLYRENYLKQFLKKNPNFFEFLLNRKNNQALIEYICTHEKLTLISHCLSAEQSINFFLVIIQKKFREISYRDFLKFLENIKNTCSTDIFYEVIKYLDNGFPHRMFEKHFYCYFFVEDQVFEKTKEIVDIESIYKEKFFNLEIADIARQEFVNVLRIAIKRQNTQILMMLDYSIKKRDEKFPTALLVYMHSIASKAVNNELTPEFKSCLRALVNSMLKILKSKVKDDLKFKAETSQHIDYSQYLRSDIDNISDPIKMNFDVMDVDSNNMVIESRNQNN